MTDSMGPGKLVRHMQNPSYTYAEYLICIGLGPSISSVICKNPSYSGPSYPSSLVLIRYLVICLNVGAIITFFARCIGTLRYTFTEKAFFLNYLNYFLIRQSEICISQNVNNLQNYYFSKLRVISLLTFL